MNLELLFSLAGTLAMTGWVVLILNVLTGRFARVRHLTCRLFIPLLLSAFYAALMAGFLWSSSGGYGSLAEVAQMFETRELLLAGWVHFLAFDLIVGCLLADQAKQHGVARGWVVPILLATFLFGPLGLLLYYAFKPVLQSPTGLTNEGAPA